MHQQVRIAPLGGDGFEVDQRLARLILDLWEQGYRTTGSCEHHPGTDIAWIAFESDEQAQKFAQLINGKIVRPEPEDFEGASPDDPAFAGAVGVGFPANSIRRVRKRVARARTTSGQRKPQR